MSDSEDNRSPKHSPVKQENHKDDENGKDDSKSKSRSRSRSASRSKSKSRSHSRSRGRSYSRSRSRSHRRSRSRSHSPYSRRKSYRNKHSRSRSRSYSPSSSRRRGSRRDSGRYYRSGRSHSRSPMSGRRRHMANRDDPDPNRCLGIFGLSLYTQERDLKEVFQRYGSVDEVQVVYDHRTGRSRGFAFLYYRNSEDAKVAKERCNGIEIDGRRIRVDFSITERAHTPTPGIYLGKSTGRGYRRSPSPRYSRSSRHYSRRSRSRSRSYSPR
ncbi:transformer-2 protein homolog beta-like isoform X2 [Tubulanus polymorphus]